MEKSSLVNAPGDRRLSRRDFLKGTGLLGVAGLAGGLIAACTPAPAPTAAPPPAAPVAPAATAVPPPAAPVAPAATAVPPAPTAVPKAAAPTAAPSVKKSVVVLGMYQELEFLNVLYTNGGNSLSASKLAQRGLLFLDKDSNWVGELAAEVPSVKNGTVTPDGLKVTYKLRKGVTWHDGKPVTSADVKATWDMIMDPGHAVITRFGYDKIASIDTPDALTVVLNFKEPLASWAALFDAIMAKHVIDANKTDWDKSEAVRAPLGFGPWKIASYKRSEAVEYEAFDGYWNGRPKIDRFVIKFYPSVDALFQAVQAKEVDIAWSMPISMVPKIRELESKGVKLVSTKLPSAERYAMNGEGNLAPIFADKTLRKALQHATDKKTIIDKLLFGITSPALSEWSGSPWENPKLVPYEYDPAKAKQMLDSIGWKAGADGIRVKDGKRLSFVHQTTSGDLQRENIQLLIQQMFKDVGVEMVIKNNRSTELFGTWAQNGTWARGAFEMGGWSISIRVPDPEVSNRFLCSEIATEKNPAGAQWAHYCNPEVDKLLMAQAKEFDTQKRLDALYKAQEIINDDAYIIYIFVGVSNYAVRSEIKNFVLHPFATFYFNSEKWEWA